MFKICFILFFALNHICYASLNFCPSCSSRPKKSQNLRANSDSNDIATEFNYNEFNPEDKKNELRPQDNMNTHVWQSYHLKLAPFKFKQEKSKSGLIRAIVDISKYPDIINVYEKNDELTQGDAHAHTMKIIYSLIREGVLRFEKKTLEESKKLYQELVNIYEAGGFLPNGNVDLFGIKRFNEILNEITISPDSPKIRFLGDELADRGQNDYFTLKLIEKLHQNQVPFEILLSNHGLEFLNVFENTFIKSKNPSLLMSHYHVKSVVRLLQLIDKMPDLSEEIIQITKKCYLPHLVLISYTRTKNNGLYFFSHAPVGLEAVQRLALRYEISCSDIVKDENQLTHCIDKINGEFEKDKNSNSIYKQLQLDLMVEDLTRKKRKMSKGEETFLNEGAFKSIVWNRVHKEVSTPTPTFVKKDSIPQSILDQDLVDQLILPSHLKFVHGHDGLISKEEGNMINLDNMLGHDPDSNVGFYSILHLTRP